MTAPRRGGRFPVVTAALVAAGVAALAFELTLPRYGMTLRGFYAKVGAVPFELAHGYDVPPRDLLPWWGTPFTSLVVPAGVLHAIVTLAYLWVFGGAVEARLGRWRFLVLFLACGLVSIAAQIAIETASVTPLVGAGGATAGVLGAFLVIRPRIHTLALGITSPVLPVPAWLLLTAWFGLQVLAGAPAGWYASVPAAVVAQAGGLVAGVAVALLLGGRLGVALRRRV